MKEPRVNAYLNPNPLCEGGVLTDPWGQVYPMRNSPHVEVVLSCFPTGKYSVRLTVPSYPLFEQETVVELGRDSRSVYFIDPCFAAQSTLDVQVVVKGNGICVGLQKLLRTFLVSGRILGQTGVPTFGYVWASRGLLVQNEVIAASDDRGDFNIRCPEGKQLSLFVGTKGYPETTMEGWIMSESLKADVCVPEVRIGNLEVYGRAEGLVLGLHVARLLCACQGRWPCPSGSLCGGCEGLG